MSNLVTRIKKIAVTGLAVATLATGVTTFTASEAEAQWRRGPGYGYGGGYRAHRGNRGAAVAAGIIGGLAAGALIAGASRPAYAAPAYDYGYQAAPAYGYAAPAYGQGYYQPAYQPAYSYEQPSYGYQQGYTGYAQTCRYRKVRQVVDYDTVVIRRVRVCN